MDRKKAYFWLMGTCIALIVLAWNVVRLWSTTAAVVMSVIAAVIPPIAVIVGNRGQGALMSWDVGRREQRWTERLPGAFVMVAVTLAVLWGVEIVDTAMNGRLDGFGIRPRSLDGLEGILFAPFLHAGFGHLFSNSLVFAVLGVIAYAAVTVSRFVAVIAITALSSGLGAWAVRGSEQRRRRCERRHLRPARLPAAPWPDRAQPGGDHGQHHDAGLVYRRHHLGDPAGACVHLLAVAPVRLPRRDGCGVPAAATP